jgi:outer membrane receptor protein involved in Fe transport
VAALLWWASPLPAQDAEQPPPVAPELTPITVTAPPPISASSEVLIPSEDFEVRPQGRPADLARLVPGVVIGQHAGGGKAEQYFIRGFDADHGTDIALFVDGMPVNLRSHAHGQGYADLHFLIPETVQRVEAFKGPYHVEFGDFATGGAINFITRDVVPQNFAEAGVGAFATQRYLTLLSPTRDSLKTLVAVEGYFTDGPFDHPQNLQRFNGFARAKAILGEHSDLTMATSYNRSSWDASGQIPARAVRAGLIDRFGSIDPSEGGDTQRATLNAQFRWRPTDADLVTIQGWGQYYALDLFSNFTFFLTDPVNGDGIEQVDQRWLAGLDARYERRLAPFDLATTVTAGFQYRIDAPRVILATQTDRQRRERTQDVDVREQSYSPFVKMDIVPLAWLRLVGGARGDIFHYEVHDNLGGDLHGSVTRSQPSVKANAILGPWFSTEFFANFGTGFHSNDARAVVMDPSQPALAKATGWELGARTQLGRIAELSLTYWVLDLESELVFVGDEGTTEARGPSHRQGWELAARLRLLDWLTFAGDVTFTDSHFDNGDAIPLAPHVTGRADLTARLPWGLGATLEVRYLGDRDATEDRSQTARGYTIVDFTARYRYKAIEAFVSIENLLNAEYREAQFFFASRLPGEPAAGVEDFHFTPGRPRGIFGGLAVRF